MIVNLKDATDFTIRCIKAKKACMISGSPGIGKSEIVKDIAKKFKLELIDIRLSTFCPEDLQGFPMLKGDYAEFVPMNTFPLTNTPIPKNKNGFLIFLDEFNNASLAVQSASYRLILDRQVGSHDLHPNTAIVCAGNLITDKAITNRLSTAMQSRLIHLEVAPNAEEWIKWGTQNKIDHRILAYISSTPDNLHNFDPKHNDKTFSCPRTWCFLSSLIQEVKTENLKDILPLVTGTVGEGVGHEFVLYTEIYTDMPTYQDIKTKPFQITIKKEPAILFGLSHMIAAYFQENDIEPIMDFIERLPVEFQTITLQSILSRFPKLIKEKRINSWCAEKGEYLL